jgi:hypothetical protein
MKMLVYLNLKNAALLLTCVCFASIARADLFTRFTCRDEVSGSRGMNLNFSKDFAQVEVSLFRSGGGTDSTVVMNYRGHQEAANLYQAVIRGQTSTLLIQEAMLGGGGGAAQLDGINFRCVASLH